MRNKWLPLLLALLAVALCGCAAQGPAIEAKPPMTVDVMLQECDGVTILGENPQAVPVGGEAAFRVKVREGYKIDSLTCGAVCEGDLVVLSGVRFPTTVELSTRPLRDLTVQVSNDSKQGQLTANVPLGAVREDTQVKLQVTPAKDRVFLGYSLGAPREDGGSIVCASAEYTFTMTGDTELYTNYYKAGNGRLVVYDGNGAAEGVQYYVFSNKSPYIGPNALSNKGQLTREGYALLGYNTQPDGSGTYYGPGWSVILPEDPEAILTLYAQWLPVTDTQAFTYTVEKKAVTITGYQGDHDTVVIPETIEGKPVTKIAAGAFRDGKFKTVYLSRNLKTIEDEAFANCEALTTLYLCDTVTAMKDEAFAGCGQLQKLYMLACLSPRYSSDRNGTYKIKYQRLISAQGKKMIFHGGSNVSYGIDIPTIHTAFDDGYAGVNFGCNQNTSSVFFTEVAAAHMNPGDILVLCPEYHKYQYGYNEMNATTWQIFEGAYNAYADVDIRNYTKVFSSFAAFNANRAKSSAETYEKYHTESGKMSVTKFGAHNLRHNGQTPGLRPDVANWKSGRNKILLDPDMLAQDYNENLNRAIDLVLDKGGKVYITFPSIQKDIILKERREEAHLQAFKTAVAETFPKAAVISDPGTYILEQKYFYNTCYHLTTAASKTRTKQLAEEILAQLEKEK